MHELLWILGLTVAIAVYLLGIYIALAVLYIVGFDFNYENWKKRNRVYKLCLKHCQWLYIPCAIVWPVWLPILICWSICTKRRQ